MYIIKYLIIIIFINFLISCSHNNNYVNKNSFSDLYENVQIEFYKKNFLKAIKILEKINNHYFINFFSEQINLDLIYAHYITANFETAKELINNFIKLYPKNKNIDYVFYLKGIIEIQINKSMLHSLLGIDSSYRDPTSFKNAFLIFSKLLKKMPNSKYYNLSQKKLKYIKECLSKYELSIVNFYFKNKVYIAVINRVQNMMEFFPYEKATYFALFLMEKSYKKLKLYTEYRNTHKLILNYLIH